MKKKKIVIFYSEGGGGHRSVAKSLNNILSSEYDVQLVLPISTILRSIDPIRVLSKDRFSGESLYNFFLKKRLFRILNIYVYFGEWISILKKKQITNKVKKFLLETECDLLISNFPYYNNAFLSATEEVEIPFIINVCDLYTKHYLHGIKNPSYSLFRHSVFFKHPLPMSTAEVYGVHSNQIVPIGLPVRPDFAERKEKVDILEKWKIPNDRPIILIIMGYFSSQSSITYFEKLSKELSIPAHIIIVLGKEEKNHKRFNQFIKKLRPNITYTCIDFVDPVSDLFYIADIVITKCGGLSVSEAMYMKKPIILDWSKRPLPWEIMAGTFTKEMGLGYMAKSYIAGAKMVHGWLLNPQKIEEIHKNYQVIPDIQFHKVIKEYVKEILEKKEQEEQI